MAFGNTIKRLRKEQNMTQDHLANLLNVTPQAISRWENNVAMPDISLLIPLANVFSVSTDTLLEVNVQKNEEHIRELVLHSPIFATPYGETLEEKLALYREKVRCFPASAELKEALLYVLTMLEVSEDGCPDLSVFREMAELTEDIIEAGGGKYGVAYHQSRLVYLLRKIDNAQRATKIATDAPEMSTCQEMLLSVSLKGREQVDARKDLIFKCTDTIINTVCDLYAENAEVLTEEEWNALASAENVVATVYGKNFDDYFVIVRHLYKGVQGALRKGKINEAMQRLQIITDRLGIQDSAMEPANPLVLNEQMDELRLAKILMHEAHVEAEWLLQSIKKDFSFDEAPNRENNQQFDSICRELEKLSNANEEQTENRLTSFIDGFIQRRRSEKV